MPSDIQEVPNYILSRPELYCILPSISSFITCSNILLRLNLKGNPLCLSTKCVFHFLLTSGPLLGALL